MKDDMTINDKVTNTTRKAIDNPIGTIMQFAGSGISVAIERSEKRGQEELVQSQILPTKYNGDKKEDFEKIGIKFGKVCDGDSMFQEVVLPDGWKKVATDHPMWSKLVDDQGRKRAGIFYKAAFYDRDAFMNIIPRFSTDSYKHDGKNVVLDGDKELVEFRFEGYEAREQARILGQNWLDKNYPDWKDATAYWDK